MNVAGQTRGQRPGGGSRTVPAFRHCDSPAGRVARPGRIVIFHDGYDDKGADRSQTVAALDLLLDRWQAEGYAFTTVDRLLGLPAYDAA